MKIELLNPKWHALLDYALVGSIIALPSLLKMNRRAKLIYAAEAAVLLPYVAMTKQPLAIKGVIPYKTHGRIDTMSIAQFAAQSLLPTFRKNRKALIFNVAFTALAGLTVLLTDWKKGR